MVCCRVFRKFFHNLACMMPVNNITAKLISEEIIDFSEEQEIAHTIGAKQKAMYILRKISRSLDGGVTQSFDRLLCVLEECGGDVTQLVSQIREELIAASTSPHKLFLHSILCIYNILIHAVINLCIETT